jgi:hypothetical protein
MNAWQPIETAPKDGTLVLLFGGWSEHCDAGDIYVGRWCSMYGELTPPSWCLAHYDMMGDNLKATHWMPLPERPPAHVSSTS